MEKNSLKTLSTISRILQKSNAGENPLAHIVSMVREQLEVDVSSLYLLQDSTLILVATDGLDSNCVGRIRMSIHEGLTGLAVEKLQPVIVHKASTHPRFKFFPESGEEKFESFAAVPLLDRERVVGVLTIQTLESREFQPQEIEVLNLITFQLAGVIHNLITLEVLRSLEPARKKRIELKGIAVAPGFGIGPAFFMHMGQRPVILPPNKRVTAAPEEEWLLLKESLDKTTQDLTLLEKKLAKKLTRQESEIFYSHRMILSDRVFLKTLKEEVQKHKSAAEVIQEVFGSYIQRFEKLEDPHFRDRVADFEDLKQRILEHLLGKNNGKKANGWEGVLIAETLVPSDTVKLDPKRISGIVTSRGGITSHASVLARSLGIPAVMGIDGAAFQIQPGDLIIVDGNKGKVFLHPEPALLEEYEHVQQKYASKIVSLQKLTIHPAKTLDGKTIRLEGNIGFFSDLKTLHYFGAEGVGLYRTEFPFLNRKKLLEEEEQFQLYHNILKESKDIPITFRMLDVGADKPIDGLHMPSEANPFLGCRSIRLSLSKPDILKTQFRAILRASPFGSVRILIPMISGMEELFAVKLIYEEEKKKLLSEGKAINEKIPFGIMIEVPSAVRMVDALLQQADFVSIGTNDLIQYTLAVDRNNERVAEFFEPLHPAVLSSIAHVASVANTQKKQAGVCGEMASDPLTALLLIGLGISQLSVIPSSIPILKNSIRQVKFKELQKIAKQVLAANTVKQIKSLLVPLQEYVG